MKVLIIEDEKDLNRCITKLLKAQQYSVDSALMQEQMTT